MSARQVTEHLWVELVPAAVDPVDDPLMAYAAIADRMTGDTTTLDVADIPALIRVLRQTYNEATGLAERSLGE
jgi:hypothetical protein